MIQYNEKLQYVITRKDFHFVLFVIKCIGD